jgi:hypothetical protein
MLEMVSFNHSNVEKLLLRCKITMATMPLPKQECSKSQNTKRSNAKDYVEADVEKEQDVQRTSTVNRCNYLY